VRLRLTLATVVLAAALGGRGGVARAELETRPALIVDEDEELADKKARWLSDKAARTVRATAPPSGAPLHPVSLVNTWTDEVLPVDPGLSDGALQPAFDRFVRCHHTQVSTLMAPRLIGILRQAASHFRVPVVQIVSGFRAAKYQLLLRKKGHEVARDSAHPRGEAIDFRLPTIPTKKLLAWVRGLHAGGVGFYPDSRFVHADVGPIRFWRGH
jgi:hypothetical protein